MSAVFHIEPEPRRAPPAEDFAAFLRRHGLTVRITRPSCGSMPFLASLPAGWRVSANHYDYGSAAEAFGTTPLHAVQRLAGAFAGRVLRTSNRGNIQVPPLLVPSHMIATDWVTRDGSS